MRTFLPPFFGSHTTTQSLGPSLSLVWFTVRATAALWAFAEIDYSQFSFTKALLDHLMLLLKHKQTQPVFSSLMSTPSP